MSGDTAKIPARSARNGNGKKCLPTPPTPGHSTASRRLTSGDARSVRNGNGKGKLRLLSRANLDGRTKARKQFDSIASGIAADLGGEEQLSTIQRHLVEAFAGAACHVNDINARLLLGEEIDVVVHSQAISTMVRIASRIGIHRVARDVSPSLSDLLREAAAPERDHGYADSHERAAHF
jgi:hypothetical protein